MYEGAGRSTSTADSRRARRQCGSHLAGSDTRPFTGAGHAAPLWSAVEWFRWGFSGSPSRTALHRKVGGSPNYRCYLPAASTSVRYTRRKRGLHAEQGSPDHRHLTQTAHPAAKCSALSQGRGCAAPAAISEHKTSNCEHWPNRLVSDYRALSNGEALPYRSVYDKTLMTVHERITRGPN